MKRFDNYIDGQWTGGSKTFENRNPANTDEVVGVFTSGDAGDVEAAANAADAAFPAWSRLAGPARGNFLYKVADLLDQRFEQISEDMTREEGKTLPESKGEVRRSINIFRYFAGEGSRFPGMLVPSERERVHMFALRKRTRHPMELSERHPGLEACARADLRQHGSPQAGIGGAAERMADCRSLS